LVTGCAGPVVIGAGVAVGAAVGVGVIVGIGVAVGVGISVGVVLGMADGIGHIAGIAGISGMCGIAGMSGTMVGIGAIWSALANKAIQLTAARKIILIDIKMIVNLFFIFAPGALID